MDAIQFRSSLHSHATCPRASKARTNGSRNPPVGVISRNFAHGRGSATFAPQPPSDGRQMAKAVSNRSAELLLADPFQDLCQIRKQQHLNFGIEALRISRPPPLHSHLCRACQIDVRSNANHVIFRVSELPEQLCLITHALSFTVYEL